MVDRVVTRAGGTQQAFVPTVYWTSTKPDKSDVTGYCYMSGIDGNTACVPVTQVGMGQGKARSCTRNKETAARVLV
jgi:hypothetical protein